MPKIRKAFVLAGGKGERLLPLTLETPKPLLEVQGKPIIEYAVKRLRKFGVKEIVLGVGYKAGQVEQFFGDGKEFGVKIKYSFENEPLGTGGALKNASALLGERFIMLNGDNLMDVNYTAMKRLHEKNSALVTIALTKAGDVSAYGVAKLSGEMIERFVEKPAKGSEPSKFINAGAYIIEPEAIDFLPEGACMIEKTMFPALAKIGKLYGFMHRGQWLPTDTKEQLEAARNKWKP